MTCRRNLNKRKALLNGNLLPDPLLVEKKLYYVLNTCPIDSVFEILVTLYEENDRSMAVVQKYKSIPLLKLSYNTLEIIMMRRFFTKLELL